MSSYKRHLGWEVLIDASDSVVGILGIDGRQWPFPDGATAGLDTSLIVGKAALLYDSTNTPQGFSVGGVEYLFTNAFTLNTNPAVKVRERGLLLSASGQPMGIKGEKINGLFPTPPTAGGGAAPVYTLPQPGALVARFSADDIPVQANGSKVTSWTDGVGGVVASQATPANQPTYVVNALGTKPGVAVNGTEWLSISTPGAMGTTMQTTNYTVLMVVSNATTSSFGGLFGGNSGGSGHFYVANGTVAGQYNGGLLLNTLPFTGAGMVVTGGTSASTAGAWGGASWRTFLNGTLFAQLTSTGPTGIAGGLGIGASNSTGQFAGIATVHEIYVWSTPLTPGEILQAQAYFCNKYSQPMPWAAATAFVDFDGDSQTVGQGATTPANSYPYLAAQALGLSYGQWTNTGFRGISLANLNLKTAELSAIPGIVGRRVVFSMFEYYNSRGFVGSVNAASLSTWMASLRALGSNIKLVVGSAFSSGSDPDANRLGAGSYCAVLDATPPGDYYVPFHTVLPHMGASGAAAANPTYFNADLVHPSNLGYAELASSVTTPIASAIAA